MFKVCARCKKSKENSAYEKGKKLLTTCDTCRSKRKVNYVPSDIEPIPNSNRTIELTEMVNRRKLNYLIANVEKYEIGKSRIGKEHVAGNSQLTLLINYYKSLNMSGEVKVNYKQIKNFGRLYGDKNLQLQNMSKIVRHTICDELLDIDMKNAHPTLLRWYCNNNDILCDGLSFYIDNRSKCLEELSKLCGCSEDFIKEDLLAIINGRLKKDIKNFPEWYINFYNNLQYIQDYVMTKELDLLRSAKEMKQDSWNLKGTTISYLMCDLENKALMAAYDVCILNKVRVCSLVYDGLMIRKNDISPSKIPKLLKKMSDEVRRRLSGCDIVFVVKEMNKGIDMDEAVIEWDEIDVSHCSVNEFSSVLFEVRDMDYLDIEEVPEEVEYVQDLDWRGYNALCINSAMGSGKTFAICKYIQDNNPESVLVISPRVSYSKSITHEFNEKISNGERFKCYKDLSNEEIKKCRRLVVSMESLHKINEELLTSDPFQLVIIDECQANLTSHTCKKTNAANFDNNRQMLTKLLRTSKKLYFSDAFINNKTLSFLSLMEIPTLVLNYKRKMKKRKATIISSDDTRDYDVLLSYISDDLRNNKRPYVCMTSATRLEKWALALRNEHPTKNIISYCKGEGKCIMDVREEWGKADCVLTTTTITVGINFDTKNYFHNCYMAFSSKANNNVVDLFQTHYRVRWLIDNEIFINLMDCGGQGDWRNKICGDVSEPEITRNLEWFEKNMIEYYDIFERAPLYLKKLLCYNQLENNLSTKRMTECVYAFLVACNYDIHQSGVSKNKSKNIETPELDKLSLFADISFISKDQYYKLNLKQSSGSQMLLQEEKEQILKYDFCKFLSNDDVENWVNNDYDNDVWMLFNSVMKKKIHNIQTEKKLKDNIVNVENLLHAQFVKNQFAVMNSSHTIEASEMVDICKELGIDFSQEIGKHVPVDKLNSWVEICKKQQSKLRKIFNIPDKRKDKKKEMTKNNCITLLNAIFTKWGFTHIVQDRKFYRDNGKITVDPNSLYKIEQPSYERNQLIQSLEKQNDLGMRIHDAIKLENIKEQKEHEKYNKLVKIRIKENLECDSDDDCCAPL